MTPRIVLSAAHCFYHGAWAEPSEYAIVSGRTRLSSNEGVEVPVDDYFYFTDKSGRQLYNPNSNDDECRKLWGLSSTQASVQLCAFAPGRDTCSGDSGGPLVVAAGGGQYRLVGDTSYGGSCGSGGVYGRLSGSPMRERLRDAVLTLDAVDIVPGVYGEAKAKKTQKQKGRKIVVEVAVKAKEDLDAKVSGKVAVKRKSYKLKKVSKSVTRGKSATLKLKPAKSKTTKKIAEALKKSKGKAKVAATLSDDAGSSTKSKLSLTLKR